MSLGKLGSSSLELAQRTAVQGQATNNTLAKLETAIHRLKISVQYPLDLAQNDFVASTIDPFIQTTKNDFLSVLDEGFLPGSGGYELDVNTDVVHYSGDVVSLVFTIYNYSGGAHGTSAYQTYTFDLAAGELVTLEDLFQPEQRLPRRDRSAGRAGA